jgi:hypothetical protein
LNVRIDSALQASAHHYQRTGRCLYITTDIIDSKEDFEELEEEEQFWDESLLLPEGFDLGTLYNEHLVHMAEIAGLFEQGPQHTSQYSSQFLQENHDSQNDENEMDNYNNHPEASEPTHVSQSQADSRMDSSSAGTELGQDIPSFGNFVSGHKELLPSNDLSGSSGSSHESQAVTQVNSFSVDDDTLYISDSQYPQNAFLFPDSFAASPCQLHSIGIPCTSLYQSSYDFSENEMGNGFTSNSLLSTSNLQPPSQDPFDIDDLWNTGIMGERENELTTPTAVTIPVVDTSIIPLIPGRSLSSSVIPTGIDSGTDQDIRSGNSMSERQSQNPTALQEQSLILTPSVVDIDNDRNGSETGK